MKFYNLYCLQPYYAQPLDSGRKQDHFIFAVTTSSLTIIKIYREPVIHWA